jgi:hypothetical protein
VAPAPVEEKPAAEAGEAPAAVELDLPEGFPEVAAGTIKTLAGELGLDKAKAQKLVERYAEAEKAAAAAREEAFVKQANEYVTQAEKHPAVVQLGGLEKARNLAGKALTTLGTPELGELLQSSGLAYHPEVLSFFAGLGKRLGEGGVAGTVGAPQSPKLNPQAELRSIYNHPTSQAMWAQE